MKIIFNVGANDLRNIKDYLNKKDCDVYAFEPLIEFNDFYDTFSNVNYFNTLVGNEESNKLFNVNNVKGCSSILELHDDYKKHYVSDNWVNFKIVNKIRIKMIKLEKFIIEHKINIPRSPL